jgi:putative FmdB family regulatory protein
MPIYEFYCHKCNTVYNFFSKNVNTEKIPNCPKCKRIKLKRQMSIFANPSKDRDAQIDDDVQFDKSTMEKTMAMIASEAEKISEDNPRQAAMLMKKLSQVTGMNLGPGMEEAISRMERGEDPEKIEEEMGDLLENEEPLMFQPQTKFKGKRPKPRVDDTLYDL